MPVSIPEIDLTFADFTLLAILLILMHGLTAAEAWVTGKVAGTKMLDRRAASTWSFAGILATLVAGVFAGRPGGTADTPFLLVPLLSMGLWAYYHAKTASNLDFTLLTKELDERYRDAVLKSIPPSEEGAATVAEVFGNAVTQLQTFHPFLKEGIGFVRRVVPVPAQFLLGELLFTPDKVTRILGTVDGIKRDPGGRFWLPPAKP